MIRLADYFVVVGYDQNSKRNGTGQGKVLQRLPEKDWDDCPFTTGLELFCQPTGHYGLSPHWRQPVFYVAVLTDVDSDRHYCAVFTFFEPLALTPAKPDDVDAEEGEGDERECGGGGGGGGGVTGRASYDGGGGGRGGGVYYAPKSLVLVSRLDCFEVFRNCLGVIYTVHTENRDVPLETLVGNILGNVHIPPPGGPQVQFSLGAGDKQIVQPPLSPEVPVSHCTVALFFDLLGVNNAVKVLCAALTDHKIVFVSHSYSRLTAAGRALVVLHYPLKYSYVYIPVLPSALLEVLHAPTPFIAGVHASLKHLLLDLLDVLVVDLDGGDIVVPECVTIPLPSHRLLSRVKHCLTMMLKPDLLAADYAFSPSSTHVSPPLQRDKEIRAIFIRMFAEILCGYRASLALIRIHPRPCITFHKAHFLGQRGLTEDDFVIRVLEGMSFCGFVADRGPPYRACDVFDEVCASIQDQLLTERRDGSKTVEHIKSVANQLYVNECPHQSPDAFDSQVPRPTARPGHSSQGLMEGCPPFPALSARRVQSVIDLSVARRTTSRTNARQSPMRMVPMGPHVVTMATGDGREVMVEGGARRLEVLRNCLDFIFQGRIADAKIIFPGVLRALKDVGARLALTEDLSHRMQGGRAVLDHRQFDLVVTLLRSALQNDSSMDEHGVAYSILPLATAFCRKLCTGVMQFAYTCLQEHEVWGSASFWEQAFYRDVHREIRQLYLPRYEEHYLMSDPDPDTDPDPDLDSCQPSAAAARQLFRSADKTLSGRGVRSSHTISMHSVSLPTKHMGTLDIAADQVRVRSTLTPTQLEELCQAEESVVYSQAIHYANRIVFMHLPLDATRPAPSSTRTRSYGEAETGSVMTAPSVAENDSYDAESGFDETETTDGVSQSVHKFITRFVDKVCAEGGVSPEHVKALHHLVPGVISMHMEILEAVHREIKRLPPVTKPKIEPPPLLPGEELVMEGLRVFLLPDGREEGVGGPMGGPTLIPAEGALFLTSYRVIFHGSPCDPLVCKQTVVRTMPVSTVAREKKLSVQYIPHLDHWLHDGLQFRSTSFQLIKVAFDEEVTSESVETLRKLLVKGRHPRTIFSTFAFTAFPSQQSTHLHKEKKEHATLGHFAKVLLRTAHKGGSRAGRTAEKKHGHKTKAPTSPSAAVGEGSSPAAATAAPSAWRTSASSSRVSLDVLEELAVIKEDEEVMGQAPLGPSHPVPRCTERLLELPCYQDLQRVGLGQLCQVGQRSRSQPFRLSTVNADYSLCRSYPAVLAVPQSVNDDSIRKFSRCYRHARFPVITWRHPDTKALLLRASGFQSRASVGMRRQTSHSGSTGGDTSSSVELEKYFKVLVAATPVSHPQVYSSSSSSPLHNPSVFFNPSFDLGHVLRSLEVRGEEEEEGGGGGGGVGTAGARGAALVGSSVDRLLASRLSQAAVGMKGYSNRDTASLLLAPAPVSSASAERDGARGVTDRGWEDSGARNSHCGQGGEPPDVALYVLGEKNQMKTMRTEAFPRCVFLPMEVHETRDVKNSFKTLVTACCPSKPPHSSSSSSSATPTSSEKGFLKTIEDSGWLEQVQRILQLAVVVVDVLDVQAASVMVCVEEGWDLTAQVVSVAQVLLDPYYRTLQGFRALVTKEWSAFGHPFSSRAAQTSATHNAGFVPVFLQFLDCVHQIHRQFPWSFEFNQHYLRYLAYHHVSNRFHSFLMDTELERLEAGWLQGDPRPSATPGGGDRASADGSAPPPPHGGTRQEAWRSCVWEHMEKVHEESAVFANFVFRPRSVERVIRPSTSLCSLVVWDYYLTESLAHGPTFDLEVKATEQYYDDDDILPDTSHKERVILNGCYDDVMLQQPDFFRHQLQQIQRLEAALGRHPPTPTTTSSPTTSTSTTTTNNWKTMWNKLQQDCRALMEDQDGGTRQQQRPHWLSPPRGRGHHTLVHQSKRSSVSGVGAGRGKAVEEGGGHRFERFSFTSPQACDSCQQPLWTLSKTGTQCVSCGYKCHDQCKPTAGDRGACHQRQPVLTSLSPLSSPRPSLTGTSTPIGQLGGVRVGTASVLSSSSDAAEAAAAAVAEFPAPAPTSGEHRTHQGYLSKQGAVFKGWKRRWFVLDSLKHQIRYYENREEGAVKGVMELSEVESVQSMKTLPGAPRKAEDNSFIEVRTVRRVYHFMAPDAGSAHDWVDKLQSCLHS
ncbi:myotubularin-related protein 13-like [Babylonia areolata]|uniref:myotubularin-related protein 13-like n=1 Tax=Babylonia areolata TaxID=304850 RepID=UPI003FD3395A